MGTVTSENQALGQLAAKLIEIRERRDACKEALEAIEIELAAASAELAAAMAVAGARRWVYAGRTLAPRICETWSIRGGRQAQVVAILKANAPSVVRETVNSATLSCYLRSHRAELAASTWWALLEPCLSRRERAYVAVSRTCAPPLA